MSSDVPFGPGSRVVAYLRDSGGDDQDLSVAQQREQVTRWADEHRILLSHIYTDEAQPGSSTIGRDAFRRMIDHFHSPDCAEAGIILWKFSRFSRDIDDAQFFKADLRRRGYIIYSLNDKIPDTIDGRIYESLIDWMNARFLEDLSTDVKRGLHHIVNQYGAIPGIPPRGFKRETLEIGKRRDGSPHTISRWVPDPDWWDRCQQAWRLRASGVSMRQIHKTVHIYGTMASYTWFFRNRIYLGELCYGDIVIPNYTEPMVTQSEWDAVQKFNRRNTVNYNPMKGSQNVNHPRRANSSFLLSGLLYCPRCGSLMNGSEIKYKNGKTLGYYICGNAHRRSECDAKRIPKLVIEEAVIKALREYVLDPAMIAERDREIAMDSAGAMEQIRTEQRQARADLAEIRRKMDNITLQIADDPAAPKTLVALLKSLEFDEGKKQNEIERLRSIENRETVFIGSPEKYKELSELAITELVSGDRPRMKQILNNLVKRICAERIGDKVQGMITFYNPELNEKTPPSGEDGVMSTNQSHRRDSNP